MISKETIREDLKNIRFYYSRREIFENGESQIGGSAFYPIVQKYNQAIREAPPRLYDLYVSLYIFNQTQKDFAAKSCITPEYVQVMHRRLVKNFEGCFQNNQ